MEVEKWYIDDGLGNMAAIPKEKRDETNTETINNNTNTTKKREEKIVTLEPEWKQEDPKNCFNPF